MLLDNSPSLGNAHPDHCAAPSPRLACLCIAACVALDFGLDPATLFETKRSTPRIAQARQIAMYLAHTSFALPFEAVGRHFGRDRTTVAHACRVIEDAREDRWLDRRVAALDQISRGAILEVGAAR